MARFLTLVVLASVHSIAFALPWASSKVKRNETCSDDHTLQFLKEYSSDTAPFCSDYLGITDYTTTLPPITSRMHVICFPVAAWCTRLIPNQNIHHSDRNKL